MRGRLILGVGLGVPLTAFTGVVLVIGAFAGANFFQAAAFGFRCRLGGPALPLLGPACGDGLAPAVPFLSAALVLVLLGMYAGLACRWLLGLPPRAGWSGMWAVGRVLAGGFVGLSALAGGTLLYIDLNNRYLHIGCIPTGRGEWMCEGNVYYGIHPLVALFTLALVAGYPLLWNAAANQAEPPAGRGN